MNTRDLDQVVSHCAEKEAEHLEQALRCSSVISMSNAWARHSAKAEAYHEVISKVLQMREEAHPRPVRRAFFGLLPA